jgi:hypothetical protein
MPLCSSRLSANLFCSLLAQPILAVGLLRQFPPFSLDKKLLLTYSMFWVILSTDPVAPAPLLAFFAFWRPLLQPTSFAGNTRLVPVWPVVERLLARPGHARWAATHGEE